MLLTVLATTTESDYLSVSTALEWLISAVCLGVTISLLGYARALLTGPDFEESMLVMLASGAPPSARYHRIRRTVIVTALVPLTSLMAAVTVAFAVGNMRAATLGAAMSVGYTVVFAVGLLTTDAVLLRRHLHRERLAAAVAYLDPTGTELFEAGKTGGPTRGRAAGRVTQSKTHEDSQGETSPVGAYDGYAWDELIGPSRN